MVPLSHPCWLTVAVLHHQVEALGILQHLRQQIPRKRCMGQPRRQVQSVTRLGLCNLMTAESRALCLVLQLILGTRVATLTTRCTMLHIALHSSTSTHLVELHCVGVVRQQAHDSHLLHNVCRGRAASAGKCCTWNGPGTDQGNDEDAVDVKRSPMAATCAAKTVFSKRTLPSRVLDLGCCFWACYVEVFTEGLGLSRG